MDRQREMPSHPPVETEDRDPEEELLPLMDDGRARKTFEDGATCVREGSSYPSTDRGASSEA